MIIQNLLETDLYKFTMWQAMLHRHPATRAEYLFVCRNTPAYPLADLARDVETELDRLCGLVFTADDLAYLRGLRYLKPDFVDFLSIFRLQRRFIDVATEGDTLVIRAHGPQVHVMPFEIFVLAIVNELYFRRLAPDGVPAEARRRLAEKVALVRDARPTGFEFFDFGVRRRFSGAWQDEVVRTLRDALPEYFRGSSNVHLARKYGLTPIGTMAHEYLQTYQGLGVRLRDFQKAALEGWVQEYRGDLGIALTDTVGMRAFLADFDLYFAKLFDGLRHDSGDPIAWGEAALAHYAKLRIDPHTKRLVFSDGLTIPRALEIFGHFRGRVQTGFGIGTNLTNDVGIPPLNIVMKLVRVNEQAVAKLSDSPGKTLCPDQGFVDYLRQVFA